MTIEKNINNENNENIRLLANEWKHSLETNPKTSVASLVSLYDLVYDESGRKWVEYEDSNKAGIKLEHDIICLNSQMFDIGNGKISKAAGLPGSRWFQYGIDISLPSYDNRAKQIDIDNEGQIGNIKVFPTGNYTLYDKDSAKAPSDINTFTNRGVFRNIHEASADPSFENYAPPEITTSEDFNGKFPKEDWGLILSGKDLAFSSTLETDKNFSAYNRLFINPDSRFYATLLYRCLGLNPQLYGEKFADNTSFLQRVGIDEGSEILTTENIKIIDSPDSESIKSIVNKDGDDAWKRLLKNTFVWVRCPFFGDYIIPDNFNQDLTEDAKVIHNEIMISGAGDFKKYDEFVRNIKDESSLNSSTKDRDGLSENSQPYIPVTSPTVDFYTSKFLDNHLSAYKANKSKGTYSSRLVESTDNKINELLDNPKYVNNPLIKSLPLTPINRADGDRDAASEDVATNPKSLIPPNYFDSETRNFDETYSNSGKFPTVLPPDGNLYVDGRVISPTIDEIWYMLKKLVGGRKRDNELYNDDIGLPYGRGEEYSNTCDTILTEVDESEFNFEFTDDSSTGDKSINKHGDPLGYKYVIEKDDEFGNNTKLVVTNFINQNNAINYPVFKFLKTISEKVTKFDASEEKARGISNFTAWNIDKWDSPITDKVVEDKEFITSGVWSPRRVPYSLRELEALGLSNKYNLITLARFIQNNFSVTGGLGIKKTSETDTWNNVAGSLYQFHKNYNYSVDNPNSYFSNEGTETGLDSKGNIVGINVERNIKIPDGGYLTKEEYEKGMPDEINKYSSSEVFLAADGSWRYVNEHIRIPILKCKY